MFDMTEISVSVMARSSAILEKHNCVFLVTASREESKERGKLGNSRRPDDS